MLISIVQLLPRSSTIPRAKQLVQACQWLFPVLSLPQVSSRVHNNLPIVFLHIHPFLKLPFSIFVLPSFLSIHSFTHPDMDLFGNSVEHTNPAVPAVPIGALLHVLGAQFKGQIVHSGTKETDEEALQLDRILVGQQHPGEVGLAESAC